VLSLRNGILFGLLALVAGGPQSDSPAPATLAGACSVIPPTAVGTQDGAFSVNAGGGATYEMDLDVPPGTQGVQPKLSVWYVSQSANGLLGNGFALEGLSSISRCQASLKLDGYNGGVGFDAKDRYCLDGQRLVKIAGAGDYGAAGSVYHTENETWTQITAIGTCGSGPCSFTATNKDGQVLEFGTGTSGVKLPDRAEVAAWQIANETDLNGNRVAVTYKFDAKSLQNLPAEIRYTENEHAGIAATRKVTFDYEARAQQVPRYVGGYLFLLKDRLKSIRTWLDGVEVLTWNLSYQVSDGTGRDLLCSLQKCTPQRVCYPATTFAYQQETNTLVSPNDRADGTLRLGWCTEANALIGWTDFNGDGLPDVHCDTPAGTHRVLLSTGKELKSPNGNSDGLIRSNWCTGGKFPSWIDFNGDAKADLACDGSDGSHRVLISNGSEVASPNDTIDGLVRSNWCDGPNQHPQWGNFNEDGRADLLCSSTDGIQRALLSTGTSFTSPDPFDPDGSIGVVRRDWCVSKDAAVFWGDFNGDHMSDAHCATKSGTQQVLLSNGKKLVTPNDRADGTVVTSWCGGADRRPGVTDFNGDGLLDSTCDSIDGKHWVLLSTGRTLQTPNGNLDGLVRASWCTGSGAVMSWADFNGDGLSDLQCRDGAGRLMALLSTGTELKTPSSSAEGVLQSGWCTPAQGSPRWTDFNADALNDVSCHSSSGLQQALVHAPGAPDLVSKVIDGIGMTVELTYAPLTDANVYTAGGAVNYPTLDIRSPMYVVSRYVSGDGRVGRYAFKYRYKGARTDLEAQRWLGFQQVSFTEEALGRQTITNYKQEYPLMSFVTSTSIVDSSSRTLASTTYEPLVRNPYPNVWEVLVAKETASTFTAGIADYTEVKSYDYDEFGNTNYIADVSTPYYEVYNCQKYVNSSNLWRMGYPDSQKTTRTAQACRDFLVTATPVWNPATDLRWSATEYDGRMNAVSMKAWDDGNKAFVGAQQTYGAAGNVATRSDPAGNITTLVWDETLTYPVKQISPPLSDGRQLTATFTYHRAFGVPATSTDPNGNVQEELIDGLGRTTEIRGPDPAASTGAASVTLQKYTYAQDITGRYVEMRQRKTWADGDPANWFYARQYQDGLGRIYLTKSRSARPGVDVLVETLYDSAGREWKTAVPHYSNASPNYVASFYDLMDRTTTVVQPDDTVNKIEYLKGQILVRATQAPGTDVARTTTDKLDPRSLTLENLAPNGGITTNTFDPIGEPLTEVRPTGSSTTTTWDSLGRPLKSVDSDTGTTTWSYGADGLLHSTTNGAGNSVRFEYDSLNRPKSRTLIPATGAPEVYLFQYDSTAYANAQGKLSTVVGPSYTEDYAYSRYALVSLEQLTLDGNTYVDRVEYEPAGDPTLRTFADGSKLRTTWYVDGTLHKQELKQSGSDEFVDYATYTAYTALQQPESLLSGNGLRTDNTYYPIAQGMARPKTTVVAKQSGPILTRSYTWSRVAEMTSMQHLHVGEPMQSETYVHDKMGWLTSATGPAGNFSYAYDLSGNIKEKDGVAYQYASQSDHLTTAGNGATFGYDGAGNMKQKKVGSSAWQYQHDAASRLAKILLDDRVVATHLYDSDDSRIRRVDGSGNISTYIAEGIDLYQSGNTVLLTKYVSGVSGLLAAVTTTYTPQSLRAVAQRERILLDPGRYDKASIRGLALWSAAVLRAVVMRVSERVTPLVAVVFLLVTSLFVVRRTRYVRRHPVFSSFIPLLLCGLVLLSGEELKAELGPGDGYPTAGTLYFHGDQVYSTLLVTTTDGSESTSLDYTPFGTIDQKHSSGPNNFRAKFTTKEHDHESGLDYFGARYYDPQLGHFLEADPQAQFASAYMYGGNDPVDMYDPDGQLALMTILIIAAVAGALTGAYMGGVAVNNNTFNPMQWDWSSGRTLAGIFAGAAIGAATAAVGAAIGVASPAAGIIAEIVLAAGENAAFSALAGGSRKEILDAALIGGVMGAVTIGIGVGVAAAFSRAASSASRLARRAESELLQSETSGARALTRCSSFPAGTLVATDQGLEPIESVTPGSPVLSKEDEKSNVVPFPVLETRSRGGASLVDVVAGGTTVSATPEHPFWVDAKGWTAASALQANDMLVTASGERVPVERVTPVAGTATVFNFQVDRGHTYFVSPLRLLVHNPCSTRSERARLMKQGLDPRNIRGGARARIPTSRYGAQPTRYGPGRRWVNFGPVAQKTVRIKLTGTHAGDFDIADAMVKINENYRRSRGLTWHHVPDVNEQLEGTLQLIPRSIHEKPQWRHWGGASQYRDIVGSGYGK